MLDGTPVVTAVDIEASLKRLKGVNKLIREEISGEVRYRLSEQTLSEHSEMQKAVENRLKGVLDRLFKNSPEGIDSYNLPFIECLCLIFSQLGEIYVRLIQGDVTIHQLLGLPIIQTSVQDIGQRYQSLDKSLFESAVISFFGEADPDYDAIKWNMAQNYYIAKAIGLDPSGFLLSKEVFGEAEFYLDTNVIIHALEPQASHHGSFKALSKACENLEVTLKACQISLDELKRVAESRREMIEKVADRIPDEMAPRIRGVFYQLYRVELLSKGEVAFDKIFDSFYHPMKELTNNYNVELVDDKWFGGAAEESETKKLVKKIKRTYKERGGRPKTVMSALHDALCLLWIKSERERSGQNIWFVTLDRSLPGILVDQGEPKNRPLAITLDALLQWISPLAIHEDFQEAEVAAIFSEAIKYQILPAEKIFDVKDFLMFAEMEVSTKSLPIQDVEGCIRYIKTHAPNLDPSSASDREKLAREMSRFFADPGRKYKQEISRLETEMTALADKESRERDELKKEIRIRDKEIEKLQNDLSGLKERRQEDDLKQSAKSRFIFVIFLFLLYEAIMMYLTLRFGEGLNLFQKIIKSWPIMGSGAIVGPAMVWTIVGRERIRSLGWPFTKISKIE